MTKLSDAEYELYKTITNDKELSNIVREKNPNLLAHMNGALFRDWLPRGLLRRLLMVVEASVGAIGLFVTGNLWFLLFFLLPLMSSPRIGFHFYMFIGTVQRGFDEGRKGSKNGS